MTLQENPSVIEESQATVVGGIVAVEGELECPLRIKAKAQRNALGRRRSLALSKFQLQFRLSCSRVVVFRASEHEVFSRASISLKTNESLANRIGAALETKTSNSPADEATVDFAAAAAAVVSSTHRHRPISHRQLQAIAANDEAALAACCRPLVCSFPGRVKL